MLENETSKFRSLTVTLAIAFLTISASVLLIAGSLEFYFNFLSHQALVSTEQELIAQDAANSVKDFIHKKVDVLDTAVTVGNLAASNPEGQKLVLEKIMGLLPAFRQLVILDEHHQELQRATRVSKLAMDQKTRHFEEELFSYTSNGDIYFSPVYIDHATSEPLMIMAVPVTDLFDTFKGTLLAEVNLKFMWDLVDRIQIGNQGVAYVVDKQGNLIAFGDISRVLKGENLSHLREVAEFVEGNESTHESNAYVSRGIGGNRVVSNHVHLGSPDWAVVVELPAVEAYKFVNEVLQRSLFFVLLCFILATIAGIYLSKKITKPIVTLRDATRKISKGELDAKIALISNNEIGELAKSFNQMVEDLNMTTVSRDKLAEEVLERKKAEKQAKSASEAKSQFLANMSHEIRTPLNAIIGFTQLLKNTTLDDVQQDYVKTMHGSGNLLLTIVNDILDFSKVEEKNYVLESIEFDLLYLIESIFTMIRSKMVGSPVDVLYRMDNVPRYFKGDPTRIRQILINLIGNALKFTEKGEIFTTIGLDPEDRQGDGAPGLIRTLRVSIRDTGIGIPEDKREVIFEAFTQADASTTRKHGGTGLGLSISKAFVEKMGGEIRVESEEGNGSEFIFTLNLIQAAPIVESEIDPISYASLEGKRVVIVDDNPHSGELFKEYCTAVKMKVLMVALSAKETLSFLAAEKTLPDLVISDMMMPEMDGYEFVEKIRRDERLKHLKIILATSEAIPGQSMNAGAKGFDGYLSKPIIQNEMINVIRAVFGDKRKEGAHIVTRHLAEEISFKGMKVLVVEDNAINMKLMENLLVKFGIIIDKADNGKEAIEILRRNNSYHLILMDMQMPEMNGVEATEIIRAEISREVPIIALTAAVLKEDRELAYQSGMNDFLEKPINVERLKEILQQYRE